MSGRKKRVRSKSGLLTGLMIVSTGLIAGFQGFDLAVNEQGNDVSTTASTGRVDNTRSPNAVRQQVNALDELVTATLKKEIVRNDSQGLAALINAQQAGAETNQPAAARNEQDVYPVVNRALKRDREAALQPDRSALTTLLQEDNAAQQEIAAVSPKPAPRPIVEPAVQNTALQNQIPFTDSADIALFAADIPLPSKLVLTNSGGHGFQNRRGRRAPLYSRSSGSPLVPRTFRSGKAFGGLAEREFQKRERRCMVTALYFEARSEPDAGQVAVGQVVMNRVRSPDYPDTICGVVYQGSNRRTGCQFSFTCDGKVDKPNSKKHWERSKRLAAQVLEGKSWLNSIGHATHYHATYVKPRWRRKMHRLKQIGRHIFYKAPKVSVTDTYQRYVSGKRS